MNKLEQLQKIGLTEKQASIYLLLLSHGDLRIQEITKLSQMPRSSVYETLKGLQDLGLIEEIVEENFRLFRPYPITSIKHHINERVTTFQTQLTELEKLEQTLNFLPEPQTLLSTVRYYKDVSGARQLFWNSLKAKTTVFVYSAFGRSNFVGKKFYMDFVQESKLRGIKEKVLVNPTPRVLEMIHKDNGTPLARTKVEIIRAIPEEKILIKGETLIYDDIYAYVFLDQEGISGFEIQSSDFAEMQKEIFETVYTQAKPLSL